VFWLLCAGVCIPIGWLLESITLHIISDKIGKVPDFKFKNAFQATMIGQLFNCITPFSSGGQPAQAYYMVKQGIPIGKSSCILLTKFIIYQSMLTIYCLFVLFLRLQFFIVKISGFTYLAILGFIVNLVVVLLLIGIGFFPNITENVLFHLANILYKLKIIKNKEETYSIIDMEIGNFYEGFQFLKQNIFTMFITSIIVLFQLTTFFSISYFICLSLNASTIDYISVLSSAAFVLMISSFVPLPGASGGAEGSFYLFFGMFFNTAGAVTIAMLMWRMLTFYMPILVGVLFTNKKSIETS